MEDDASEFLEDKLMEDEGDSLELEDDSINTEVQEIDDILEEEKSLEESNEE